MKIIIFSKNRAAQLDLLLRSIDKNILFPVDITVQYSATDDSYQKGYNICSEIFNNVKFIREDEFKKTLLNIFLTFSSDFMFLVDDNVIINKLTKEYYDLLVSTYHNDNIHTLSLRMHEKIDYCYPAKKKMEIPYFIENKDYLLWDWTKMDQWTCWGYPMHVDSQIFVKNRTSEIFRILLESKYHHPNSLEEALLRAKNKSTKLMLSSNKTIIWNIQNNFVQGTQSVKDVNIVLENNKKYLDGYRIRLDNIQGIETNMAHGNIDLLWEKE